MFVPIVRLLPHFSPLQKLHTFLKGDKRYFCVACWKKRSILNRLGEHKQKIGPRVASWTGNVNTGAAGSGMKSKKTEEQRLILSRPPLTGVNCHVLGESSLSLGLELLLFFDAFSAFVIVLCLADFAPPVTTNCWRWRVWCPIHRSSFLCSYSRQHALRWARPSNNNKLSIISSSQGDAKCRLYWHYPGSQVACWSDCFARFFHGLNQRVWSLCCWLTIFCVICFSFLRHGLVSGWTIVAL